MDPKDIIYFYNKLSNKDLEFLLELATDRIMIYDPNNKLFDKIQCVSTNGSIIQITMEENKEE